LLAICELKSIARGGGGRGVGWADVGAAAERGVLLTSPSSAFLSCQGRRRPRHSRLGPRAWCIRTRKTLREKRCSCSCTSVIITHHAWRVVRGAYLVEVVGVADGVQQCVAGSVHLGRGGGGGGGAGGGAGTAGGGGAAAEEEEGTEADPAAAAAAASHALSSLRPEGFSLRLDGRLSFSERWPRSLWLDECVTSGFCCSLGLSFSSTGTPTASATGTR
jgi:hypothetical protein